MWNNHYYSLVVTACSVFPPPTADIQSSLEQPLVADHKNEHTHMHSLAFHISSSLSERAHYRQNLALTLSQPALLCSVFTLAQNVSSLKASELPSSCWEGEGGREKEREGGASKCSYTERPEKEEGGVDGKAKKERGQAVCQRKGGGVTAWLRFLYFPWALFTTYSIITSSFYIPLVTVEWATMLFTWWSVTSD